MLLHEALMLEPGENGRLTLVTRHEHQAELPPEQRSSSRRLHAQRQSITGGYVMSVAAFRSL